ncbi:hypothetical protein [Fusibacter bizertensis]
MNRDEQFESKLKNALNSNEMPESELLNKLTIKLMQKENLQKKPAMRRTLRISFVTVMLLAILSGSAFAAWQYLSENEVADKLDYPLLAEAFNSEDAVIINETQQKNGYTVSLLGLVSGDNLTELDNTVDTLKTYAVVAIKKDDTDFPPVSAIEFNDYPFFVSPIIKGQEPWLYNIASMNGGYSANVFDGVLYRLIECDGLEIFADRGLSLVVISSVFYDVDAFNYDETTGLTHPNDNYEGLNLIFDLPIRTDKSDHAKAQQYLDNLWDKEDNTEESNSEQPNSDTNALGEYRDPFEGITVTIISNAENYRDIMELKFTELEKMVEEGSYSEEKLSQDKLDYKENLKLINEGATLTLTQYIDGTFTTVTEKLSNLEPEINEGH